METLLYVRACDTFGYISASFNDYSRFCWTIFLASKSDTFSAFENFAKISQNKLNTSIITIRSDHGGEFENHLFEEFCETMTLIIIFPLQELHNKME